MGLTLKITETDGAAFDDGVQGRDAMVKALRDAATAIESGATEQSIRDVNGNTIGSFEYEPNKEVKALYSSDDLDDFIDKISDLKEKALEHQVVIYGAQKEGDATDELRALMGTVTELSEIKDEIAKDDVTFPGGVRFPPMTENPEVEGGQVIEMFDGLIEILKNESALSFDREQEGKGFGY